MLHLIKLSIKKGNKVAPYGLFEKWEQISTKKELKKARIKSIN